MRIFRSLARSILIAATALAGLVVLEQPAGAATAAPWRFTTVTQTVAISGVQFATRIKEFVVQCPAGYLAVSGGVVQMDIANNLYLRHMLEYPDSADGTYIITLHNRHDSGMGLTIAATCVWKADIGTVTLVTKEFTRNANGRAGGEVRCPAGTTVLNAGMAWSNSDEFRRIDYSGPITDGTDKGTGWYAAGYSQQAGVLGVELRCVDSALLTGEYVEAADSTPAGATALSYKAATAVCTANYRNLTGGAYPTSRSPGADQGATSVSGPLDARQWLATGGVAAGVTLRSITLCIPASTPSVSLVSTPGPWSTTSENEFLFSTSDTAGETLAVSCDIDGLAKQCSPDIAWTYTLADGIHSYLVVVRNQSGGVASAHWSWRVDTRKPTIYAKSPTESAALTESFTVSFSEPVTGVSGSSVEVRRESNNALVAGAIQTDLPTTMSWTPAKRLIPGETYRVSFTDAIHDIAGNAMIPTYYTVRAVTKVENASEAAEEFWDLDSKSIASGGRYITSRQAGSKADLNFTAAAGQAVSVYGIRLPDGGLADVFLDGTKVATRSFYAASAARARVYLSPQLTAGAHTISIRPTGTKPTASKNSWVSIDNVNVGLTAVQETGLKQTFRNVSTTSAGGGSYDLATHATDSDATPTRFRFTVVGSGVQIFGTKTPASGKARIYIDGVLKQTVDLKAAATTYAALVFSTSLPLGQHVVRIEAVGTASGANSGVGFDYVTVA